MIKLEKKIEEAARIVANLPVGFDYDEESYYNGQAIQKCETWIAGAKSSSAKEYWQHEMYTKEEVLSLLEFVNDRLPDLYSRFSAETELQELFEQNKKKS